MGTFMDNEHFDFNFPWSPNFTFVNAIPSGRPHFASSCWSLQAVPILPFVNVTHHHDHDDDGQPGNRLNTQIIRVDLDDQAGHETGVEVTIAFGKRLRTLLAEMMMTIVVDQIYQRKQILKNETHFYFPLKESINQI